jgi:hypothetical protein
VPTVVGAGVVLVAAAVVVELAAIVVDVAVDVVVSGTNDICVMVT